MRAALHHLASDIAGALFGSLILCGYALLLSAVVYGIIRLFEWATPQNPAKAPETTEDGR